MFHQATCKVILQARVSSTRLPKKTILDFHGGKGILEILVDRIKLKIPKEDIIIATSTNLENNVMEDIADKCEVNIFRGNENNVLDRFIQASIKYNADNVLRVCSDNVFIDLKDLKRLYHIGKSELNHDYIAYQINDKPNILTHYGLWGELIRKNTLEKVAELTDDIHFQEHVTNYIYTNKNIFSLKWLNPLYQPKSRNIRLTTDTAVDFNLQRKFFKIIYDKFGLDFETFQIISEIAKNREHVQIMNTQIKANEK